MEKIQTNRPIGKETGINRFTGKNNRAIGKSTDT